MESITQPGIWWLPDNPTKTIAGTLTFSDKEGAYIDFIGSFRGRDEPFPKDGYPVILGSTTKGEPVTLQSAIIHGESSVSLGHSGNEFRTQRLYVNYAFFGAHFQTPDDIRFHKADIALSHLQDWLGYRNYETEYVEGDLNQLRVTYTLPRLVSVATHKGTITVSHRHQVIEQFKRGIEVKQSVSLVIEASEMSFRDWHSNFIYPLQTFLTLATNKWNSVHRFCLFSQQYTLPGHAEIELPIEAYFQPYNHAGEQEVVHNPLFTFEQVKDDISGIMDRWLNIIEKYQPSCELFFSVMLTPRMYIDNQFLNLVQAAESFHRIKTGNNDRFLQRIEALVEDTWSMIPWMIGDRKEFIKTVRDTRNYYTHRDLAGRSRALHGEELNGLAESIKFMLHAVLLKELLLPPDLYNGMFRNGHYQSYGWRNR